MPGPQDPSDQAADAYERGYGAARRVDLSAAPADRPARGSLTDLRQHLERLPPGHPSSPYHDDGSRKPPVVRLRDLELPLSDDTGATETEARDAHPDEPRHEDRAPEDHGPEDRAPEDHGPEDRAPEDHRPEDHRPEDRAHDTTANETTPQEADLRETASPAADPHLTSWPEPAESAAGSPGQKPSDAAGDRPQTRADGSWEWKGSRLTSGQCKIADEMLGRCRAAEGRTVFGTYADSGLTPAMRRVEAQLEHGRLVPETEKFALKSADRFKEKLAKLIARFPGAEPGEVASGVHDSIRYTFLFEAAHYTPGVADACGRLAEQGFEQLECRPSWNKDEYKGVNSRWRDPATGLFFEIQWHTPESWDAKQKTHAAYEKIDDKQTPITEVKRLRAYQREVSATVAIPPGALQIRAYKKES
jgi:hypothetical protein